MNYFIIPTLLLGLALFWFGAVVGRQNNGLKFSIYLLIATIAAVPGFIFVIYYLRIFGEPIGLYEFRSWPGTELTGAGAGFLAGLLQGRYSSALKTRRIVGRSFFPGILLLGILIPYLKPIIRPPKWDQFKEQWSEEVCLQTSESSCGPACAVTILRHMGKPAKEMEIARASFTSRSGTENWYLARTLRHYGLKPQFLLEKNREKPWPHPAIAGVQLPNSNNSGHFITILGLEHDKYIIGDPMEGKIVRSRAELESIYRFTGFFMRFN